MAQNITLGDLVSAVQDCCRSDDEVVATLTHMISSGAVRLRGNVRVSDAVRVRGQRRPVAA